MGLAPTPESTNPNVVLETNLPSLKLLGRGKVRDVYEAPSADRLLIVTTDRISAFDAILATGMMMLAFLSLTCGMILDSVARGRREAKRMAYLAMSATPTR